MSSNSTKDRVPLGIATCILEILTLTTIATIVKYVSPDISVTTILFFRYLFSLPLLIVIGVIKRGKRLYQVNKKITLAARTVIGITGLTSYFIAIALIGIGKTIALGQLVTIFITMLAPIMLSEKVGLKRWIAVTVGLIGTIIIIKPSHTGWFNFGIFWGINSAFFAALLNIFLRKLGNTDEPISTALWYNTAGTVLFSCLFLVLHDPLPDNINVLLILISCGLLSSFQQFFLAFSRSLAPAIILAPLQYLAIPSSFLVAIYFFNENLGWNFILGTTIIIFSTFYISVRSRL